MERLRAELRTAWASVAGKVTRPVSVTELFVGPPAFHDLADEVSLPAQSVDVYDNDQDIARFYVKLGQQRGPEAQKIFAPFHLGAGAGNILDVPVESLVASDGLIGGWPCPPWSSIGKRGSFSDPKSAPLLKLLEIIIELFHGGCLKFFALENSTEVLSVHGQEAGSAATYILKTLK